MSVYEITYRFERAGETVQHETRRRLKNERLFEEVNTEILATGIRRDNERLVGVAYVRASYASDRDPFPTADSVREIKSVGELHLENTSEPTVEMSPDDDTDRFLASKAVQRRLKSVTEQPDSGLVLNSDLTLYDPYKRDRWLVGHSSPVTHDSPTKQDILKRYRRSQQVFEKDPSRKIGIYNDGSQVELFPVQSFPDLESAEESASRHGAYGLTNFHRLELSKTAVVLGDDTHVPGGLDARFQTDDGETITSRQLGYMAFYLEGHETKLGPFKIKGGAYHPLGFHAGGTLYHPVGPDDEPAGDWERLTLETYRRGDGRPWQFGLVQTDDAFFLTQAMAGPSKFDPVLKRYSIEKVVLDEPLVFSGDVTWIDWPTDTGYKANRREGTDIWVLYQDSTGWHLEQPIVEDSDDTEQFQQTSVAGIECARVQAEPAPPDRVDEINGGVSAEREYRLTEEALPTYEQLYVLAGHERREESEHQYQWRLDDATAYEILKE